MFSIEIHSNSITKNALTHSQSGHKGLFKYRMSRFSTPPDAPLPPVSESELLNLPPAPSPHFDLMILEQHICVCPSYSN